VPETFLPWNCVRLVAQDWWCLAWVWGWQHWAALGISIWSTPTIWLATTPGFGPKLAVLQTEAQKLGTSIDALVLAACLSQPFADVVLSGATKVEQIFSNLQACRLNIDGDAMARLSELAEPPEMYWATRSKLPWN
jgi:diketogulonate reductase-like aldo/keto reductase